MAAGAARLGLFAGLFAVFTAVLPEPIVAHVALTAGMCAFHGASYVRLTGRDCSIRHTISNAPHAADRTVLGSIRRFRPFVRCDRPVNLSPASGAEILRRSHDRSCNQAWCVKKFPRELQPVGWGLPT